MNDTKSFKSWADLFTFAASLAEIYVADLDNRRSADTIKYLKELSNQLNNLKTLNSIFNRNNIDKIHDIKRNSKELFDDLLDYRLTPNLNAYASTIEKLLYECILNNALPDYSSYFLNRFNSVAYIVPRNTLSLTAYEQLNKMYKSQFDHDIEKIKNLREAISSFYEELDESISIQEQNNLLRDSISTILKQLNLKI